MKFNAVRTWGTAALLSFVVLVAGSVAQAKTCTWIASGGSWDDAAKWADGALPEDGDEVVVAGGPKGGVLDLGGGMTAKLAALRFEGADYGWNVTNGTVCFQSGTAVVSNDTRTTVKVYADFAAAGAVQLVKRGGGTLEMYGENSCAGSLVLEAGRYQPLSDASLGAVPVTLQSDAIILRGGILGNSLANYNVVTVVPTRGITLEDAGELCARSAGILRIESPITGTGDLRITRQSGRVQLAAANSYVGRTVIGYDGLFASSDGIRLDLLVDGALPATTTLDGVHSGAELYLSNTVQRVAAVEPSVKLTVEGPGTLRFGTVDDADVSVGNLTVRGGATLAYAGAGTVVPTIVSSADATFALESGSCSPAAVDGLGKMTVSLAPGTAFSLPAGAFTNDLVLTGTTGVSPVDAVTLSIADGTTLLGNLTRTEPTAALAVTGASGLTFGANDATLRTFDVPVSGVPLTLDGWVRSSLELTGYTKSSDFVFFDASSGVPTGNLTIDGFACGIFSPAQTGDGSETISVVNGGHLVLATEETLTAGYAITVDATSTLELGGLGTVDLSSATISGSGTLKLPTGTVRLAGDLSALTTEIGDCTLDVPDGATLTLGDQTGDHLVKTGAGTLVFAGATASSLKLRVAEGTVRLASEAQAVSTVTVLAGATLVLDADEQIANNCLFPLWGTFDLNGHTETIAGLKNKPEGSDTHTACTGAVVNTAEGKGTLITTSENGFYGRVTENPGAIEIQSQNNLSALIGPAGAIAPSSISSRSSNTLMPYTQWSTVKFVFHRPLQTGRNITLSEIQLTCQGVPVPTEMYKNVSGSPSSAGGVWNLVDGRADTFWKSANTEEAVVYLSVGGYPRIDGYRIAVSDDVLAAPTDWDVYVTRSTDATGYMPVDSRRGVHLVRGNPSWTTFQKTMSTNFLFSGADRPAAPFAATTAIDLASGSATRLRVGNNEALETGSVTGGGGIRIENGAVFAPGDLTDWTGAFSFLNETGVSDKTRTHRYRNGIALNSERGAAAQRVNATGADANVKITNAGTSPVAVLLDDTSAEAAQRGELADGAGPLGLVKRGSSTRVLATENCSNTGSTVVEAGTLTVARRTPLGSVTARYLRIQPTRSNGGWDSNGFNWGMNDFQLLDANGARIAFPSGTTTTAENGFHSSQVGARLIDGDISTRCLVWNTEAEKTAKKGDCAWVVIDMKQAVTFASYRWYTAHNNAADQNRVPIAWTFEASDDGTNWTLVDATSDAYTLSYGSGNNGFLRGPYVPGGSCSVRSFTIPTLPVAFQAGVTDRSPRVPAIKARYFKWQPHETYNMTADANSYGWMIANFSLFRNGARVAWPDGATPTLTGGAINTTGIGKLAFFCDNVDLSTASTVQEQLHRVFVTQMPSFVTVDAGEEVTFDAYGFHSAAAGCRDARVPTAWTFFVSTNGTDWTVIDERAGERDIVIGNYALQGPWSVANLYPANSESAATSSLGDASPVAIHSGATLGIASAYERFGNLSGAGTLALGSDTVAEINAVSNGVFSGSVTGGGTLAVCGVATQTFDNASLAVSALELNGGVVQGTASFGGNDLSLVFGEGATWAELSGIGMLTVSGTPVIQLPADAVTAGQAGITLVSAQTIPSAAQDAFRAARVIAPEGLPSSWRTRIHVSGTQIKVHAGPAGTVLVVR